MTPEEETGQPSRSDEFEASAVQAMAALDAEADIFATTLSLNLFRVVNRLQRDLEVNAYRPQGISGAAFSMMFVIKAVGEVSPTRLAVLSSTSTASTSSLLNTLEKYGYVTRTDDKQDGRRVIVKLTPAGEKKLAEVYKRANQRETNWVAGLTQAESLILLELLRTLLRRRTP